MILPCSSLASFFSSHPSHCFKKKPAAHGHGLNHQVIRQPGCPLGTRGFPSHDCSWFGFVNGTTSSNNRWVMSRDMSRWRAGVVNCCLRFVLLNNRQNYRMLEYGKLSVPMLIQNITFPKLYIITRRTKPLRGSFPLSIPWVHDKPIPQHIQHGFFIGTC